MPRILAWFAAYSIVAAALSAAAPSMAAPEATQRGSRDRVEFEAEESPPPSPVPYYLRDDVQYFAPAAEFQLIRDSRRRPLESKAPRATSAQETWRRWISTWLAR